MGHQRRFERAPATSASLPIPDLLLSRSKRRSGQDPNVAKLNRRLKPREPRSDAALFVRQLMVLSWILTNDFHHAVRECVLWNAFKDSLLCSTGLFATK